MSVGQLLGFITSDLSPSAKKLLWRFSITIILLGHVSWACGLLPGISGFALADDMAEIQGDVKTIEITLLEQAIFEQRMRHCGSGTQGRSFHLERLQTLLRRYRQATGANYQLPPCDEIQ